MSYVLATSRQWYEKIADSLSCQTKSKFLLINQKNQLSYKYLIQLNPRYIFFPHWSYNIQKEIYENFECVIFHMTDLPFGRGGSPLQNLVSRGIYETQISALKCIDIIDGGPVYLKHPFSLYGSAEEIYLRATKIIEEMIIYIVENKPEPVEQEGEPVFFDRRQPQESNIAHLNNIEQVFDYIRMLDADGYPNAFLEVGNFRFEFQRASLRNGYLLSDVQITLKKEDNE